MKPSVDSQTSLALLYQPDHCVEFLQVLKVAIQHFGLYHEIRRFSIVKISRSSMLTVINIKRSHFCHLNYLASSASPSIKSSNALACWEFPNPFSHFVWLRVFAKRYFSSIPSSRKQKRPEPGTTESDVWLRMFFYLLLCDAWTTETFFEIF